MAWFLLGPEAKTTIFDKLVAMAAAGWPVFILTTGVNTFVGEALLFLSVPFAMLVAFCVPISSALISLPLNIWVLQMSLGAFKTSAGLLLIALTSMTVALIALHAYRAIRHIRWRFGQNKARHKP